MLFLLVMEALHKLFKKKLNSLEHDLLTNYILIIFGEASGFITNLNKTEYFPHLVCLHWYELSNFKTLSHFYFFLQDKYLGLPLHYKKPTRAMFQPLVQQIANRLPDWKKDLLSYPGREILVKFVLYAIPTYFLTIFKMRKWAIASIDKFRRGFLWKGQEVNNVSGGHCLVNWKMCLRPKKLRGGGLELKIWTNLAEPLE
jgi:hypothetical protein